MLYSLKNNKWNNSGNAEYMPMCIHFYRLWFHIKDINFWEDFSYSFVIVFQLLPWLNINEFIMLKHLTSWINLDLLYKFVFAMFLFSVFHWCTLNVIIIMWTLWNCLVFVQFSCQKKSLGISDKKKVTFAEKRLTRVWVVGYCLISTSSIQKHTIIKCFRVSANKPIIKYWRSKYYWWAASYGTFHMQN